MVILVGPNLVVASANAQQIHFSETDFDKVTFSQMSTVEARRKCEEALQDRLLLIVKTVKPSSGERERLMMAGKLDIHRYFARYDEAKRKIPFGSVPRDEWQQISSESHAAVRSISREFMAGLHGTGSLFRGTLVGILDAEELRRVATAQESAARAEYADHIDTALLVVGRQVKLPSAKRMRIKTVLLEQTKPPAMLGSSLMPLYFVLANMGELEEELRPLFDDEEWKTVGKLIQAGRTATR